MLQELLAKKSKGKGQYYIYTIPDKDCTLVISHQMEKAIRDKDIIDVMIAQRSEKIIMKLENGLIITLPLVSYDGKAPLYKGEGWTRKGVEECHHHGKETYYNVKLFEALECCIEEWELEMMRLANKRRKALKGEGTADWKEMMVICVENIDWEKFEEETKEIVTEINEPVDDKPISMEIDDMEKTKNVNEKLKHAGKEVLRKLPTMTEIPELIKIIQGGELTEIANVSGISITLPSIGKECFVPGQKVNSEEGELFVPGQTIDNENGVIEYIPGFTVLLDNEPTLLPGLVMGDDPNKPMFLPGESTITESGELQFAETEDDIRKYLTRPDSEEKLEDKSSGSNSGNSSEEEQKLLKQRALPLPPPPPPFREKSPEFVYERPKRLHPSTDDSQMPKKKEKRPKKSDKKKEKELKPVSELLEVDLSKPLKNRFDPNDPVLFDLTLPTFEKDLLDQERERVGKLNEKKSKEELIIDRRKREIKAKVRDILKLPSPPHYEPQQPAKKSETLKEYESQIKTGKFFNVDHKKYMLKNNQLITSTNWKEPHVYGNTFESVGLERHRIWKSVY
ncbi:hypothetical protein ILUMI_05811 [Ignelater luminosus]|uniref:Uncharacterized protein n=1 Tax=Ignelater luminosus TaxID=2038154 RepID=A0A8K0GJR9_IGNLU|nr:hypothetical protein ILUMI_05811 [Ignelater luminosus]